MRIELVTPPAVAAIELADIKTYMYSNTDALDDELTNNIQASINYVESRTGRRMITQTYDVYLDSDEYINRLYAYKNAITLSTLNVQSIDSVTTYSRSNVASVVDDTTYRLSGNTISALSKLVYNDDSPIECSNLRSVDSVKIRVVCGYGDASSDVPEPLINAMAVINAHWVKNGSKRSTTSGEDIPENFKSLIAPYISVEAFF